MSDKIQVLLRVEPGAGLRRGYWYACLNHFAVDGRLRTVSTCLHDHKSNLTAMNCAKRMLKRRPSRE